MAHHKRSAAAVAGRKANPIMNVAKWITRRRLITGALALTVPIALIFTYLVIQHSRAWLAVNDAREALQKGLAAVASDRLDPHRYRLVRSPEHCQILMETYYRARDPQRLEWSGQSCLYNGIETAEVFIGLSAAHELFGRDTDALELLAQLREKFKENADIPYRQYLVLRRIKRNDDAALAMQDALALAPKNTQLQFEGMQFFSSINRHKDAYALAVQLKGEKTDNPEVKLLIAEALKKGGDAQTAKLVADEARALLQRAPAGTQQAFNRRYQEIFGSK